MTVDALILLSGTFVALLPFLGFPSTWDTVLLVIVGLLIISLGIVVRRNSGRIYQSSPKSKQEPLASTTE
ncbi:MAG: hypothetical protein RIQ56_246 [Candidatus Parcubacteria bacterium]|jgi:hypothetical protein